ncbi:type II secretion system F family protein [Symbiobacterium thermophilum]|uniref:Type II secretion system protein GspF domain-containing protein n=1 Tax=Symbiobacterium thermophilum TaxID=2734 RepID=A0A953LH06_SYMTR|nr:type II secretion system F family protein [Symbiobacterium thermophilum]MBY6275751.1 hypothetical protein [Symbiobacterium thermophilum]
MRLLIGLLSAGAVFLALMPAGPRPAGVTLPGFLRPGPADRALRLVPVAAFALVLLLTGSWLTALISLPAGVLLLATVRDTLARREAQALRDQLQEALLSLATSLKAGQSLPRALQRCAVELSRLHPGGGGLIREIELTAREVELGTPVDEALLDLRARVPLEELAALVDALVTTRRRGGNIVEVMGNVAQMVADRLAVEREIQVLTAQKRTEAAILAMIPLGIYLVVRVTNPAYLAVFHATLWGQAALGLILLAVAGGYWMAQRIASIDM